MKIPFYDTKTLDPDKEGFVDIERIYCFDWDLFDRKLMDRLRNVFESLPQSKKHDPDDCHWWYADREDIENGYLTAGIEPPGLQVFGTLPMKSWEEWNRAFQAAAAGLPVRNLT